MIGAGTVSCMKIAMTGFVLLQGVCEHFLALRSAWKG